MLCKHNEDIFLFFFFFPSVSELHRIHSREMWVCSSEQVPRSGCIKGGVMLTLRSTEESYKRRIWFVAHGGQTHCRGPWGGIGVKTSVVYSPNI